MSLNIKRTLFLLAFLLPAPSLYAAGGFDVLLNPHIGKQRQILDLQLDTSSGTTSLTKQSISSFTPIWHGSNAEVGFSASAELLALGDELTLPTTGDPMPDSFMQLNFGPVARYKFANGWILGTNILAGSASNDPFSAYNTLEITANAALIVPTNGNGQWVFFLNYSSNRDFWRHVPLPGFGYALNKSWGRGLIGIPALYFKLLPGSKVNFQLRYFPIIRTYADIGLEPSQMVRVAGYFQWDDDHYWRTERQIENRQIFIVEKTLGVSAWFKLHKGIDMKLSGGWRFNRYIFEGKSIIKDTNYNRINLDSTPFGGAEISVKM